jgi:hypothetical protein
MLRMKFATAVSFLCLVASSASAEYINFKSTAFSGAYNKSSYSFAVSGGTTVTAKAGGLGSTLYWDTEDGLGVKGMSGYETDEIDSCEYLTLSFSKSTYLDDVFITDLFKESGYLEIGYYSLNGGGTTKFLADASQVSGTTNGEKTLDINTYINTIKFTAPGKVNGQNHEFALGGIKIGSQAVPELDPGPAGSALALLIAGCLALYGRRRRLAV